MGSKYALLSVSDKAGVVDFGRALVELGYTLLSSGGTASALHAAGVAVTKVSDYTGAPEIMDGRVKTLHPRVHGGILGDRVRHAAQAAELGIPWIDVVAVNLYPFENTVGADTPIDTAIETIDIGGPAMVRASAKNHQHVAVLTDPADYPRVVAALRAGGTDLALRRELAIKAFRHTSRYDSVISGWLAGLDVAADPFPAEATTGLRKLQALRYGENPHQRAAFYADNQVSGRSLARARQLQGKELSFNNLADLDAALRCVFEFEAPSCTIVKHNNPCGTASAATIAEAYAHALAGDPVSAYGGIVVFNRPLTPDDVDAIKKSKVFYEVLAAPGFVGDAADRLKSRENLRVMELPADWAHGRPPGMDARRVQGGWLLQDWDVGATYEWRVASARPPTDDEARALRFAWLACRNVKSNAIVLATALPGGEAVNGVGAGQMSRVDSVKLAISKATLPVAGCVLASDAFFPFADGVEEAGKAGVTAIIQPGGSIRDAEILAVAEKYGMAVVMTGTRHFRH